MYKNTRTIRNATFTHETNCAFAEENSGKRERERAKKIDRSFMVIREPICLKPLEFIIIKFHAITYIQLQITMSLVCLCACGVKFRRSMTSNQTHTFRFHRLTAPLFLSFIFDYMPVFFDFIFWVLNLFIFNYGIEWLKFWRKSV